MSENKPEESLKPEENLKKEQSNLSLDRKSSKSSTLKSSHEQLVYDQAKLQQQQKFSEMALKERQADLNEKEKYITNAKYMTWSLLSIAVLFTISLTYFHYENNKVLFNAFNQKSQSVEHCSNNLLVTEKEKIKMQKSNLGDVHKNRNIQPDTVTTRVNCDPMIERLKIFSSINSVYTPLIYLNIFIYFISIFILISIHRIQFFKRENEKEERKAFKEIFAPILEVIKDIVDYFKQK